MVEAASTGHRRFPSKPVRAEDAQVNWVQLGHRTPLGLAPKVKSGEKATSTTSFHHLVRGSGPFGVL